MRIGIDIRSLALGRRSGVEEYVIALLSELFRIDRQNEYILFFNAWGNEPQDFSWLTQHPNVTLRKFRIPNKLLNFSLWYLRWPKLDRLLGGVDIFFLPNINFCAVSDKTKLFVTAHDLSFEMYPETFSWKQRAWHFFVNPRRLLRSAYRIFSVSQSTKDDLVKRYLLPPSRIEVIRSGVGKNFREYSRNDPHLLLVKEKYHLPYTFILYLGAFEPRKNITAIIRAFGALKKAGYPELEKLSLVLAGVSGWKEEGMREEIKKSPWRKQISLPGFIADEDKPALYNLASCFAYPSLYEGFGFPALEALACGVPVITSHSTSLPEIVGEAAVLVDPSRPQELFLALEQVLLDKDLRALLREKGLVRAKKFLWSETARRVLSAFEKACSSRI